MRADYAIDTIVGAIANDLGQSMARASVLGIARRVGITGNLVTSAELSSLLDELMPGLSVFVGRSAADAIVQKLRMHLVDGVP